MPGGQGWRLLPGLEAYHRIAPPSPLHEWVDIIPASDGSEDLLVVYSRKAQTKKLTHEEILAAAEKFLMPAVLQEFRESLVVRLDDMKTLRQSVADERRAKGIAQEINSLDDWKTLLPESYEMNRRLTESYALISVESRLQSPLTSGEPPSPEKYRNVDEYRGWLVEQAIGPQARFILLRQDVEISWEVQASVGGGRGSVVPGGPVAFRSTKNTDSIIFSADSSKIPEPSTLGPLSEPRQMGFFLLGPAMGAR
jgi:hypothetical protein